jgi:beta-lactamase regulating signal transducer with metallopeptidase domain
VYDLFLSKETFFTKNRWYLLSTPALSFLLPLIKIPTFQKAVSQEYIVQLPGIFLSPETVIQSAFDEAVFYESVSYMNILFWVGVAICSVLFLFKLTKIISLINKYKTEKKSDFILISIPNQTKAFSFFNYIFLGKEIPESQKNEIIAHELVHSKQRHSWDLLFFEFLKIVMWFNPMIYLYQKRITLIHEYISDEIVAKKDTRENYINNLLSSFFQVENISFTNQFYKQTFIKKRIMMMTKKQSKKMNQLKYLVLIPMLVSMLFYTSCSENAMKEDFTSKKQLQTTYTLNIDNELSESIGEKESYLDMYMGTSVPKWKEISYNNLTQDEQLEYDTKISKFRDKTSSFYSSIDLKLYKGKNNRNVMALIIDIAKLKETEENRITETTEEREEVSFMVIDKAPTFPGCESGDKDCFSKMVQKHFARNFNADLPNTLGLSSGRKRIFIGFKIDKEGNIVDVQARAPHKTIKEEVLRVMNALPIMIPGENKGKTVAVKYAIPFTIIVGADDTEDKAKSKNQNNNSVSFYRVDKIPTFPGCDSGDKDCFSKGIQKHFGRNFDSNIVNNLGLESGKSRLFVGINITTNGNIDEIKIKADHPKIEKEVRRVMRLLPNITPGENNGKKVAVKYSIPFTLIVE